MIYWSSSAARRRVFYPRPILSMPDILMIDISDHTSAVNDALPRYHPILVETIAEQSEFETYLDQEHETRLSPDVFDKRPSTVSADYITIAHYASPASGWPYVLLCRWPPRITAAAPEDSGMFVRSAYTAEFFDNQALLERASDRMLTLLRGQRRARVEIVLPDWSPAPGVSPH